MLKLAMIIFATSNSRKFKTWSQLIKSSGIQLSQVRMNLPEPRSLDVTQIACAKVLHAFSCLQSSCLAVDSAFFIPALGGFPATFVNFILETIRVEGIIRLLEGKDRACEFKNCLAYMDPDLNKPVSFISSVSGTLALSPRGQLPPWAWSELYQVFIPSGRTKTLAEMKWEEYTSWSRKLHQDSGLAEFIQWFKDSGRFDARKG